MQELALIQVLDFPDDQEGEVNRSPFWYVGMWTSLQ